MKISSRRFPTTPNGKPETGNRERFFRSRKKEDAMLMPVHHEPSPSIRRQAVVLKVAAALLHHVESRKLGQVLQAPCDVLLPEKTVIQPDILFVERTRRGIIGKNNLRGAPDLVVEVLSRDARERKCSLKRRICSRFEIPEYWEVDTDADTVETLLWSELGYISAGRYLKRDRLSSPLLPNLNLPLSRIFSHPDE
jgi:Uma2 family endonuclease